MEKKKIAESIIIRVGGGIRSIPREPLETEDAMESSLSESDFDQSEDMPAVRPGLESILKSSKEKTIN